jgi:hypothetical protein
MKKRNHREIVDLFTQTLSKLKITNWDEEYWLFREYATKYRGEPK